MEEKSGLVPLFLRFINYFRKKILENKIYFAYFVTSRQFNLDKK